MTDRQRADFEAWAKQNNLLTHRTLCNVDLYERGFTQDAWETWQAALASPEVQALRKQNKQLLSLVEEMSVNDTYETEYDGRMYSICHGCGAQDDEWHRANCVYERARAALAAMEKQK